VEGYFLEESCVGAVLDLGQGYGRHQEMLANSFSMQLWFLHGKAHNLHMASNAMYIHGLHLVDIRNRILKHIQSEKLASVHVQVILQHTLVLA